MDQPTIKKRASGSHLGEVDEETCQSQSSVPDFEIFPEYLRKGPWSPAAVIYLFCFGCWVIVSAQRALETFPTVSNLNHWGSRAQCVQLCCGLYCVGVNMFTMKMYGRWPFASYTIFGYLTLTARFLTSGLGLHNVAEVLRFPSLIMAWVTTTVWWFVLAPLMFAFMPGGASARLRFLKFNFSFFLLNVHLFNLPLAMIDHRLTWRPASFCDLWVALAFALIYVIFYLLVLDRNGMHFYIFLSPRRAWCCIPGYSMVISIYIGTYYAFG